MTTWPQPAQGRSGSRRFFSQGPRRPRSPRAGRLLAIEELECRRCPSAAAGLAAAAINLPVDPNVGLGGQLQGTGSTELYHVSVNADGLLVAQVHALGLDTRLSLLDDQGNMLIESEASSSQNPDDRVEVHVTAGDYFLMVQDLTGNGTYYPDDQFYSGNRAVSAPQRRLWFVLRCRGGPEWRQGPRRHCGGLLRRAGPDLPRHR